MKRTNLYAEEEMLEALAQLAKEKGVSQSGLMRKALELGLSLLGTQGWTPDIEFCRQKLSEKNGEEATVDQLVTELAREKAIEYRDKKNNSARITTVVEVVKANTEEVAANTHTLAEVTTELAELKEQIKQLVERSPK